MRGYEVSFDNLRVGDMIDLKSIPQTKYLRFIYIPALLQAPRKLVFLDLEEEEFYEGCIPVLVVSYPLINALPYTQGDESFMLDTLASHNNNNLDPIDLRILLPLVSHQLLKHEDINLQLLWVDRLCIFKEVDGWRDIYRISARENRTVGLVIREGLHYVTTFDGKHFAAEDEIWSCCGGRSTKERCK